MASIKIVSPTKAYITFSSEEEKDLIVKITSFKNKSKEFMYRRHMKNVWFKQRNFEEWKTHGEMLKSQIEKSILFDEDGRVCIRPGFIPFLEKEEVFLEIQSSLSYPAPRPYPWYNKPKETPYPYQTLSVEKMLEQKHAQVQLCTGAGKSLIILMLCQRLGLKCVVVTPSASIFEEMVERFQKHFGQSAIGMVGNGKKKFGKNITIAISDSLSNLKEGTKEYDDVSKTQVVIGDESHTIPAETRESVFHGVLKDAPYRFFLSGTQTRGDGTDKLLHAIIGQNVHNLTTKEAIEGGFVNDHSFKIVSLPSPNNVFKSPDALAMKRVHLLNNKNIANFVATLANSAYLAKKEQTLILVDELPQIVSLIPMFRIPYAVATSAEDKIAILSAILSVDRTKLKKMGVQNLDILMSKLSTEQKQMFDLIKQSDPTESVEKFNKGEAKVLIGTTCISTGTNIFPTHHTVNWQGGSSEVRTKQGAVGRSVRKLKGSKYEHLHVEKPKATIWDFDIDVDVLKRHLKTRLSFYKSSGTMIEWIGKNSNLEDVEEEDE